MPREWYALIITLLFCDGRPFCINDLITTKNLLQINVMIFGQIICTGIAILVISIALQCSKIGESPYNDDVLVHAYIFLELVIMCLK